MEDDERLVMEKKDRILAGKGYTQMKSREKKKAVRRENDVRERGIWGCDGAVRNEKKAVEENKQHRRWFPL